MTQSNPKPVEGAAAAKAYLRWLADGKPILNNPTKVAFQAGWEAALSAAPAPRSWSQDDDATFNEFCAGLTDAEASLLDRYILKRVAAAPARDGVRRTEPLAPGQSPEYQDAWRINNEIEEKKYPHQRVLRLMNWKLESRAAKEQADGQRVKG